MLESLKKAVLLLSKQCQKGTLPWKAGLELRLV